MNSTIIDVFIFSLIMLTFFSTPFIIYFIYKNIREHREIKRLPVGTEYRDRVFREHPETGMHIQPIEPDSYCLRCGSAFPPGASTCPACGAEAGDLTPANRAKKTGIMKHDLVVGDEFAFREGELVKIESMSLDPGSSEVEYVVISRRLDRSFHLSADDLMT